MTYTVKIRTLPGSPMMSEYECPDIPLAPGILGCGRFELLVARDASGDPPPHVDCPECGGVAELQISAPKIRYWSRPPVPIGYASKSDVKDPRALDTEDLATGKLTRAEWGKKQRAITHERRYQKRLKAGKISKRVQVGGG